MRESLIIKKNKTPNTMNKKIALMALGMLLTMGFATSCGDDEKDEQEPKVELPTQGAITGWTSATHVPPEGGRSYFQNFHSPGETATINVTKDTAGHLTLIYSSNAWGKAEFKALTVSEKDGRYILPADTKTTIVMERGAMGQQGGGGEYELTLLQGSIQTDLTAPTLVMSAFMNPNHGSYELTFNEGDAPAPVVQ